MMKIFFSALLFLILFPATAQNTMTPEKWQEDLNFLKHRIHSEYPFLFKKISPEEFDAALASLQDELPNLQTHEIVAGITRLTSMFGYGHTYTDFGKEPFTFRHFPFNLYQFSDGIYIQGIHQDYQEALGARVVSIGRMPVKEALKAIYPVTGSENDQYFKAYGINYLRIPELLHAQGMTETLADTISLKLEKDGRTFDVQFKALSKGVYPPAKYGFIQTAGEWLDARETSVTPYYLKELNKHYYFEYLPEHKAVYVRHSQVVHDSEEDIPTFFARVFRFIEENDVERLILDVRLNSGGNNYFNKPLVRGIIQTEKIDQIGKFYVILGRRTFSACQNLVSELDTYTNAIFVGEPTSENINFYGDNNRVDLPNSGLPLYLSFAWWQDKPQWEDGPWMAPHVAVDMSYEDYVANKDPVLETALNFNADGFVLDPMQYMTELYMSGQQDKLVSETKRMISDPRYEFYDFEGQLVRAGRRVLKNSRLEEALAIFGFVTNLFPDSAKGWLSLGEAHEKAGQPGKAIEFYRKARDLDVQGEVGQQATEALRKITGR